MATCDLFAEPKSRYLLVLSSACLVVVLASPIPAIAQVAGAAERAAARAAARAAERNAVQRAAKSAAGQQAVRQADDLTLRRWNNALCKRSAPCPLPDSIGKTFKGSYNEVALARDTVFYRVYTNPQQRLGTPGEPFSYWTRSDARGLQAAIDAALPVSRTGNTAQYQVAVRVPKGTRVFEGETNSLDRYGPVGGGPIGGGNQVVINRVKPQWVVPVP